MNEKQIAIVGSLENAFGLLPNTLEETFIHNLDHSIFKKEKIEVSVNNLSKMGKFWQYVNGLKPIENFNDSLNINQINKETIFQSLLILLNGVDYVEATFNNGQKTKCVFVQSIFKNVGVAYIDFSYLNPIKEISLHIRYDLADNIVIQVNSSLFKEIPRDITKERLTSLNCKITTGESLINVLFQPCCDKYANSAVSLYSSEKQLMVKMNVNQEMFFHSITGLAFGQYFLVVEQFDEFKKLLIQTDFMAVNLSRPNYGGKPIIYNG